MKKILLPVDGSKRSIRTVEMVKQLCDPADSDITGYITDPRTVE